MYFNTKYEHSGVVFQGRFKSKHINNEPYFRYIFAYVHLNSLDLFEPDWKEKGVKNLKRTRQHINTYPYSSFCDFVGGERPERAILSLDTAPEFLKTQNDFEELAASLTEDRPL